MPVNLSIKNAPDQIVDRLKLRAARHHRSMQGEVLAILEEVTRDERPDQPDITDQLYARIKAIGHPSNDSSVQMIREDRDSENR